MHINSNDVYGQYTIAREEMTVHLMFCAYFLWKTFMYALQALQFHSVLKIPDL